MMDKTIVEEIREEKQKEREKETTKITYCLIMKEWVAKHATNKDLLQLGLQLLGMLEIVCTKVSK
jgi:hypothetical protein